MDLEFYACYADWDLAFRARLRAVFSGSMWPFLGSNFGLLKGRESMAMTMRIPRMAGV